MTRIPTRPRVGLQDELNYCYYLIPCGAPGHCGTSPASTTGGYLPL